MNAREYYLSLQAVIHAAPHVLHSELSFDEIDTSECYVRGTLLLMNDLELHVAEYVITEPSVLRLKYRYHLQAGQDKTLVSRWDNVPHYPQLSNFPHHRHDRENVAHPSPPIDIYKLLDVILEFIGPGA